ncbi:MAG: DUF1963 domain-containing protein [Odoribacteraceae bacterium]|jgi:uncharacterized protein YwqG|nr:DUF1963 domain-containing protein [Odoribacteraceae bacterium]
MGLLGKLFGHDERAKEESVPGKIVTLFKERTAVETVKARPAREACAPWASKLGGIPYLPAGFPYPLERREGREEIPLRFLAQLNFSEMPALEGFPGQGILQFYIGNDEQYGMDHETLTAQKGFRVIYHAEVSTAAPVPALPAAPGEDPLVRFPFDGELKLYFEKETAVMGPGDFRFDKLLLQFYNEVNPANSVRSLERIPEKVIDEVYDSLAAGGHRVGGYPAFAQLDPREYHDYLREHTVLLLQLDTEHTGDYAIAWGEAGLCHFFIRPDDLAAREFIEVLYSWDCY